MVWRHLIADADVDLIRLKVKRRYLLEMVTEPSGGRISLCLSNKKRFRVTFFLKFLVSIFANIPTVRKFSDYILKITIGTIFWILNQNDLKRQVCMLLVSAGWLSVYHTAEVGCRTFLPKLPLVGSGVMIGMSTLHCLTFARIRQNHPAGTSKCADSNDGIKRLCSVWWRCVGKQCEVFFYTILFVDKWPQICTISVSYGPPS